MEKKIVETVKLNLESAVASGKYTSTDPRQMRQRDILNSGNMTWIPKSNMDTDTTITMTKYAKAKNVYRK